MSVSARAEKSVVIVKVKDNGVGIPAAEQEKIWDRLYRGDKSRSQRGLGLGLSVVKAVVQAHQGKVTVTSEPGHGSEFIIVLPASSEGHVSQASNTL